MNPADYGKAGRDELMAEYVTGADMLAARHILLSNALADRERQFWHTYENDPGESVSARSKSAQAACLAQSVEVIEIRGEINEITTNLNTIRFLLDQREMITTGATFPPDRGLDT